MRSSNVANIEMEAFERARMLAFGGLSVVVAQWPFRCGITQKE